MLTHYTILENKIDVCSLRCLSKVWNKLYATHGDQRTIPWWIVPILSTNNVCCYGNQYATIMFEWTMLPISFGGTKFPPLISSPPSLIGIIN